MMITDLLSPDNLICDLRISSKKQLFQEMATLIVKSAGLSDQNALRDIVTGATERERLGSTGVGSGVALPHARLEGLDKVYGAFARLETPLEYDSVDDRPVDLVFFLLAPSDSHGAHLRALAQISRRLRREALRTRLRAAPDVESLYTALIDDRTANAA